MTRRPSDILRELRLALARRFGRGPQASGSSEAGAAPRRHPSITLRVSLACAAAVVLFSVASGAVIYAVALEQAQDAQDERLEEVVGTLARSRAAFAHRHRPSFQAFFMDDDDFDDRFMMDPKDPRAGLPPGRDVLIQTLHRNGRALPARFEVFMPDGYHTVTLRRREYRLLIRTLRSGAHVVVAERSSAVPEAAAANALNIIVPFAILATLLGGGLALLVWRTMHPVNALAADIAGRTGEKLAPVGESDVPEEILPLITAFNGLLSRVRALRDQEARFVADAAHELRSPLTALSLQSEALELADLTPEARERVRTLRAGIDRAVRQVSQLLALKRAQAQPGDDEGPQTAPIVDTVGEVVESVYWEAERLGVTIEVEGLEDLPEGARPAFAMRRDDLFTLLRNLLENAVRYSPAGGAVTLRLESAEPPVLSVSDEGSGIPAEERARVLEPFYRRLGTGVAGTGLGLAIVKTLCDRWDLELTLDDARPDRPDAPGLRAALRPRRR